MTHQILIAPYFEKVIENQLATGKYNSVQEVIQQSLSLLDKQSKQNIYLDNLLLEGEQSGNPLPFDNDAFKKYLHNKYL
jgi:antitoxin ParD1/3/4